jgi:hypothetical protein
MQEPKFWRLICLFSVLRGCEHVSMIDAASQIPENSQKDRAMIGLIGRYIEDRKLSAEASPQYPDRA